MAKHYRTNSDVGGSSHGAICQEKQRGGGFIVKNSQSTGLIFFQNNIDF